MKKDVRRGEGDATVLSLSHLLRVAIATGTRVNVGNNCAADGSVTLIRCLHSHSLRICFISNRDWGWTIAESV